MLSREDNELITRVGPGTPMGNLMREYWMPAMLSSELPAPDCDPVRVLLLGEQLIAFRDTNGKVGLIQNNCPHRGASLFFGRNEEAGLRCVYHGWKFDVDGNCVDMPNEPAESDFKTKVKAVAYPTQERGGIVWAYLGPRADAAAAARPRSQHAAGQRQACVAPSSCTCNWLQVLEGDIDTSHVGFLHYGSHAGRRSAAGHLLRVPAQGPHRAASRSSTPRAAPPTALPRRAADGQDLLAHRPVAVPVPTMSPPGVLGTERSAACCVPMDDEHTLSFSMQPTDDGRPASAPARRRRARSQSPMQPNTTDWYGRFRRSPTPTNDFLIDRDAPAPESRLSGLHGHPAASPCRTRR